jgi:poly(3-hydroxybutyrate) depolymerase
MGRIRRKFLSLPRSPDTILLRELVIRLLSTFQVFITDWVNARYVPRDQGPFNLEKNACYIVEMMEH